MNAYSGERQPRVGVVQDGARLHYAIPIALQRAGILERVWTDFYIKRGTPIHLAARLAGVVRPTLARRMLGRYSDELDSRRVVHRPLLAVQNYRQRRSTASLDQYVEESCAAMGKWMTQTGLGYCNSVFGFIRDFDPEFFRFAKDHGCVTVGDQMIAPLTVEVREAQLQAQRFPGWEARPVLDALQRLESFQQRSWDVLDHFTCASEYVRDGLITCGVAGDRITVIPYPIDASHSHAVDRSGRAGPLTIGFIGAVNLRKGAPYFFEIARRFKPQDVRFVMVGPVMLEKNVVEAHRGHVELIGAVPRWEVSRWLAEFDIFCFPSTCEGSAGAVIEAMATGLPIVASPNSGTFARHGIEGFLHAYDDIDSLAESIHTLAGDADSRTLMGAAASSRVKEYGIDSYALKAGALFHELVKNRRP